jgi:hypothetical protein
LQIYLELLEKNAAVMATGTTNSSPTAFDAPSDEEAGILLGRGIAFLCEDAGGLRGALAPLLSRFIKSQLD